MSQLLTSFLLACYAIPALLGHGGLHALYGVEHDCLHHNLSALSEVIKADQHQCCGHHLDPTPAEDSGSTPSIPTDHSDEDCSLCQYFAQGQTENPAIQVELLSSIFLPVIVTDASAWSSCCDDTHAPRGPPSC